MLAMNMNSVSIGYGSPARSVADHRVHQAVRGERRFPGERLVDAQRLARVVDQQIFRAMREAERRSGQRLARLHFAGLAGGLGRRNRPRIRRLVAEAARRIDRAEQHLQKMQRAAGVEAVGMRRDAAHRVHRDRRPIIFSCRRPVLSVQGSAARSSVERGCASSARCGGWSAAAMPQLSPTASGAYSDRDSARRAAGRPARADGPSAACSRRSSARAHARIVRQCDGVRLRASQASGSPSSSRANRPSSAPPGSCDHQPRRIRVAHQIVEVDRPARSSSWISANTNSPSVPGRMPIHSSAIARVAGAHRIDRDDLGAARLELAETELDRIASRDPRRRRTS